jgi:hypothetical protein
MCFITLNILAVKIFYKLKKKFRYSQIINKKATGKENYSN